MFLIAVRKYRILILSITLIVASIVFGLSNDNGPSLGEFIFKKVGLPVSSNGTEGAYYPGILSLIVLVIGLWLFRKARQTIQIKNTDIILAILIFFAICKPIYTSTYDWIRGYSDGLKSIDLVRNASYVKIDNGNQEGKKIITAFLRMKNYGKERKIFKIRLIPIHKDLIEKFGSQIDFKEDKNIVWLPPNGSLDVRLSNEQISNKKESEESWGFQGKVLYNFKLELYNEKEKVVLSK